VVGAVRADRRRAARAARLGVIANVVVRMELGSMGYTFSIQRAVGLTNHDVAVVGAVRVGALNIGASVGTVTPVVLLVGGDREASCHRAKQHCEDNDQTRSDLNPFHKTPLSAMTGFVIRK